MGAKLILAVVLGLGCDELRLDEMNEIERRI
jgi:hypothetical protein